jgi:alpha-L-fucosidase
MTKSRYSNPVFVAVVLLAPLFLYGACVIPARTQQPAGAPANTPSEQDIKLEQAWQKASSKYDTQRGALNYQVDAGAKNGPFQADWNSLAKYKVPAWFQDAKFGIFIHWGVYSVPAFSNEWYPRHMYETGSEENKHQIATYGPLSQFGYKDFIPRFKAEHFDPKAWASLFRDSGAKYVVPVFEHHDGFAMYDSDLSDWTAAKMGPHRDVAGELVAAFELKACTPAPPPTASSTIGSWVSPSKATPTEAMGVTPTSTAPRTTPSTITMPPRSACKPI